MSGLKLTYRESHACQRAIQRQGQPLTSALKTRIIREIKRAMRRVPGKNRDDLAAFPTARPQPNGCQSWRVNVDGVFWHVVYQTKQRLLVTVLPNAGDRAPWQGVTA